MRLRRESTNAELIGNWADNSPVYYERLNTDSRHFFSIGNPFVHGHPRTGVDFLSVKETKVQGKTAAVPIHRGGYDLLYRGSLGLNVNMHNFAPDNWASKERMDASREALDKRGAEAWNRLRPAQPDFSAANELFELKDVPGMLKKAVKAVRDTTWSHQGGPRALRRAGEYHLALQFGWLPLLGAVQDFVETQRREQRLVDQIIRDAGRPVRRRTNLPLGPGDDNRSLYDSGVDWPTWLYPIFVSQAYASNHEWSAIRTASSRTWAEGRFTYFLPPGPQTVEWKKGIIRRIYGFQITPSMVYEAMPWSWLFDYFTGLGQFVKAVSNGVEDRLYCDYAYLMKQEDWYSQFNVKGMYHDKRTSDDKPRYHHLSASTSLHRSTKIRRQASPFGWGLKSGDLSPMQLSILGALGLSRL